MEFLQHHILPMSAHHLQLLEYLAVLTYMIHLPFVGVAMGATALSMWLTFSLQENPNRHFERFAGELIETFLGNKAAIIVLGVLPLLVLPLIYSQWFNGTNALPVKYVPWAIPIVALGFVLLSMYRASYATRDNNPMHLAFGAAGLGMLKLAYLVLFAATARLHDPEKWYRVKDVIIMILNFNVIWKFMVFLHLAGLVTGVAILFFFFKWPGKDTNDDPEYARTVRRFGGGITLAFSFALPVFTLFYVFTTPDVAFDSTVYLLAVSLVFVAMVVAGMMLRTLSGERPRATGLAFVLVLLIFGLSSAGDLRSMAVANQEHAHLIAVADENEKAMRDAELHSRMASGGGAGAGEEVFKTVCSTCHRMDERLVGPPLNSVLPKYAGNVEGLKAFISNPVKVNPDYIQMPKPPVTPTQIDAVAHYLLGETAGDAGAGH